MTVLQLLLLTPIVFVITCFAMGAVVVAAKIKYQENVGFWSFVCIAITAAVVAYLLQFLR